MRLRSLRRGYVAVALRIELPFIPSPGHGPDGIKSASLSFHRGEGFMTFRFACAVIMANREHECVSDLVVGC